MNREQIIRMALKSGFAHEVATGHIVATSGYTEVICTAGLERFAALVAAAERDACAKIAESWATEETEITCENISRAIRAAISKAEEVKP